MPKALIYAYRDWSFENLKPALDGLDYDRYWFERGDIDISKYSVIVTCEPHIEGWRKFYPKVFNKLPILALQQGLYWAKEGNPNATWRFDKYMVWGEQMRECCLKSKLTDDRITITGCPRWDKWWDAPVKNDGYTLVLGDGSDRECYYKGDAVWRPHPAQNKYQMQRDTEDLIRCADKVVFKSTGIGLLALIMDKKYEIYKSPRLSYEKLRDGTYTKDEFLKWAITGNNATERVRCEISQYL